MPRITLLDRQVIKFIEDVGKVVVEEGGSCYLVGGLAVQAYQIDAINRASPQELDDWVKMGYNLLRLSKDIDLVVVQELETVKSALERAGDYEFGEILEREDRPSRLCRGNLFGSDLPEGVIVDSFVPKPSMLKNVYEEMEPGSADLRLWLEGEEYSITVASPDYLRRIKVGLMEKNVHDDVKAGKHKLDLNILGRIGKIDVPKELLTGEKGIFEYLPPFRQSP